MGGHLYNEPEPLATCPYCNNKYCTADFVDVGIGMVQCGPYHCDECTAYEIGPYDKEISLSEEERKIGWYKPNTDPTKSSGNVINGKFVTHKTMLAAYRNEFMDNPLYEDEEYVEKWYENIRKGL